jgi:NAD-dependent deacetylase
MVKESTISFGQSLVADDLRAALTLARGAGVMLVVGSSLAVNPAAKVPREAARSGAILSIINNEPTPLDDIADILAHAPAGAALTYLVDALNP